MTDRAILLVEDNPDDEALTLRALKKHNILNQVTVAHDGAEALDLLFTNGSITPSPGLILLDLKLPKVDGLEVLRRIRADERTKIIPVVVLTSSKEQEDILASYGLGANAYVRKPVKFSEFTAAVSTLGLFWLLLNETAPDFIAPSDLSPDERSACGQGGVARSAAGQDGAALAESGRPISMAPPPTPSIHHRTGNIRGSPGQA
jgi:CheY-like chemotaxis protein